eukprot:TRINITY_DN20661_c0_g1_i1.p1 TRINITY_DN20661_c0_g1~~TRINITY_DN20661_c0_g1_i1.p1  ORF type:complete len:105 (+),score=41.92 TRINITY_DN20661_c0_g1_i1:12-326(+)
MNYFFLRIRRRPRSTQSRASAASDVYKRQRQNRCKGNGRAMNIHEYQAKQLLAKFGVAVPRGGVAYTPEEAEKVANELGGPVWVVKSQIHALSLIHISEPTRPY